MGGLFRNFLEVNNILEIGKKNYKKKFRHVIKKSDFTNMAKKLYSPPGFIQNLLKNETLICRRPIKRSCMFFLIFLNKSPSNRPKADKTSFIFLIFWEMSLESAEEGDVCFQFKFVEKWASNRMPIEGSFMFSMKLFTKMSP